MTPDHSDTTIEGVPPMTAPTLKLSDLAGPDASGYADVAVFVRADGSESEPFVVLDDQAKGRRGVETAIYCGMQDADTPVRRLGRGRLEPARIEMEGEATADLAEQVWMLRGALTGMVAGYGHNFHTGSVALANARAALAATAPKPQESTHG